MKKYLRLLKYEIKSFFKDALSKFFLLYPLLMLFICGFLLPEILDRTASGNENAQTITLLIAFVVIISMGGYVMGVLLGFSLLDNKDENTLISIAASPVTVSGYANFKTCYSYVFAIIANMVMLGGLKLVASDLYVVEYAGVTIRLLDELSWGNIVLITLVGSLMVPTVALIVASIAKNKIEGFAFMKSGGIFVMLPLLALLDTFRDWKQYLLGIMPNFWFTKPLLNEILPVSDPSDLPFWAYLAIGTVYMLFLAIITHRMFMKRNESN